MNNLFPDTLVPYVSSQSLTSVLSANITHPFDMVSSTVQNFQAMYLNQLKGNSVGKVVCMRSTNMYVNRFKQQ